MTLCGKIKLTPECDCHSGAFLWFCVTVLTGGFLARSKAWWFLLCLFILNLIFYIGNIAAGKIVKYCSISKEVCIVFYSILIGALGISLSIYGIHLPIWIDTACSAMPFFMMGYMMHRHSNILVKNEKDRWLPLYALILLVICFVLIALVNNNLTKDTWISFRQNKFTYPTLLYLVGAMGLISIILIAKMIKHLPIVSSLGRYSIIVLVTHMPIIYFMKKILLEIGITGDKQDAICILLCILLSWAIVIPLCRKFLPKLCAQKDLISIEKYIQKQNK